VRHFQAMLRVCVPRRVNNGLLGLHVREEGHKIGVVSDA